MFKFPCFRLTIVRPGHCGEPWEANVWQEEVAGMDYSFIQAMRPGCDEGIPYKGLSKKTRRLSELEEQHSREEGKASSACVLPVVAKVGQR